MTDESDYFGAVIQNFKIEYLADKKKIKNFWKRIGIVGFLFFLIKGLIWLAVFFGAAKLFDW